MSLTVLIPLPDLSERDGSNEIDLSAPIDVYSDWIDAAEAVGRSGATGTGGGVERDEEYDDEGIEV